MVHNLLNSVRQADRYLSSRYFSAWLILLIDTVVSVFATFVAYLLLNLIFPNALFTFSFGVLVLLGSGVISVVSFMIFRTFRSVIRHATFREAWKIGAAILLKGALMLGLLSLLPHATMPPQVAVVMGFLLDILLSFFLLLTLRVSMIIIYDMIKVRCVHRDSCQQVLVYGTGDKSVSLVMRLQNSPHYRVVGFLTYGKRMRNHTLVEHSVYYFEQAENMRYLRTRLDIDAVLFASTDEARAEQERLVRFCMEADLKILIAPPIDEVVDGKIVRQSIREIKIEDLLGRPEIRISMEEIADNLHGKVVMVTGAAGSIGSELCRQLAHFGVGQLVLYDNGETPMHNLRLELEDKFPHLEFVPVIGDVRMEARLDYVFRTYHPQVVFHAAAYKHVPLMEENPCEAVLVNVTGTRYVADKCIEYDVEKMVMISTDKAVNPTNIMGCTKRLAEIYVQSLGLAIEQGKKQGRTKFVTTRFGNVLGSNGSVIPRFRAQIAKGGPVTVTDRRITRFFMTIPEACRLVMEAATISSGNQIFVFDMGESVKIDHLARRMIELAGFEPDTDIPIVYSGLRPGEKLFEEVLSNSENTMPTSHDRIRIAKVREYDYAEACAVFDRLSELTRAVDIPDVVRLMKRTVPEFKSQNSKFEEFDEELKHAQ